MDLSAGAKITTSRGGCPGADAKVFAAGKKFCGRYISPWTAETGCGYLSPRKVRQRGTGRRSGRQEGGGKCQRRQALRLTSRQRYRRDAMSAGNFYRRDRGRASGHGCCTARVFSRLAVAKARNRACGFGGAWRVRQQLPSEEKKHKNGR
ncbi:TPA: hypothetical protein ACG1TJ_004463 [Salmonella enterica]